MAVAGRALSSEAIALESALALLSPRLGNNKDNQRRADKVCEHLNESITLVEGSTKQGSDFTRIANIKQAKLYLERMKALVQNVRDIRFQIDGFIARTECCGSFLSAKGKKPLD